MKRSYLGASDVYFAKFHHLTFVHNIATVCIVSPVHVSWSRHESRLACAAPESHHACPNSCFKPAELPEETSSRSSNMHFPSQLPQ